MPRYRARDPQGSRADVRAKGLWRDGVWSIEFARKLDTGHKDDLVMAPGGVYLFGVSRYEMAYGEANPEWAQPLFKSGDAFDRLMLHIDGAR